MDDKRPPPRYQLLPPKDRQLDIKGKLGFADVYPQQLGQEEDKLTESNVRQGFIPVPQLQNEVLSAFEIFGDKLEDKTVINQLRQLADNVAKAKAPMKRFPSTTSFRHPVRSGTEMETWMKTLASSDDSLKNLALSIPAEPRKRSDLLHEIVKRRVPITRATWLVKSALLYEVRLRGRLHDQDFLSLEWSKEMKNFLHSQLELLKPLPPKPVPAKGRRPAPEVNRWAKPEERNAFYSKWRYSIQLARWHYAEGLLDQKDFLKWSLDQLGVANFDQ
ncbi:RNA polymerase II mediator complex subunit, partial [Blyttiomyces sp. JEL0837]